MVREVRIQLLGGQVEVGEDHDPRRRVLQDLRPPAGVRAGVERLAQLEPERFEGLHHPREEPARAAEGVVVVVGPAQAQAVLAELLDPRGAVARLPVVALDFEDQVAGQVDRARPVDDRFQDGVRDIEPFRILVEPAAASFPKLAGGERIAGRVRGHEPAAGQVAGIRLEAEVSPALHRRQRDVAARNLRHPVRAQRRPEDLQAEVVRPREGGGRLDLDRDLADFGPLAVGHDHPREDAARVVEDRGDRDLREAELALVAVAQEPALQVGSVGQDEMVDPVNEPGARLGGHPPGQLVGEGVPRAGGGGPGVDGLLGLRPALPVEGRLGGASGRGRLGSGGGHG
jgi:hypothetical protein